LLSRWENGSGRPDLTYQRWFCRVYERDADELGFTGPSDAGRIAPRIAPAMSAETLEYFAAVFRQHIQADQLMGPHHLVEAVRAQTLLLERILEEARSSKLRDDLLQIACQYNEFTGWLYQDAGDTSQAMMFSDRAMDCALAPGDPTDAVYLLMRKSNIACDQNKHCRAVGLAQAATRYPSLRRPGAPPPNPRRSGCPWPQQISRHAPKATRPRPLDPGRSSVGRSTWTRRARPGRGRPCVT
jgi:hypothetical protein